MFAAYSGADRDRTDDLLNAMKSRPHAENPENVGRHAFTVFHSLHRMGLFPRSVTDFSAFLCTRVGAGRPAYALWALAEVRPPLPPGNGPRPGFFEAELFGGHEWSLGLVAPRE